MKPASIIIRAALGSVLALITSSCTAPNGDSSSMHLSDRASIRSVSIASEVRGPKQMSYMDLATRTKASLAGAPLALLGGLLIAPRVMASSSENHPKGKQLSALMSAQGYPMERIVREAFSSEIRKSGYPAIKATGADAEIRLTYTYGLSVGLGAFAKKLGPNLSLTAELVRPDGKMVWKQTHVVISDVKGSKVIGTASTNLGKTVARTYEEYSNQPQLLRTDFAIAAQAASLQLVRNLKGIQ